MPTIVTPEVIDRFKLKTFWMNFNTDECVEWIYSKHNYGYGQFMVNYKMYLIHVISYAIFNNLNYIDFHVLHHCDNPPCINPHHLFSGTQTDNIKDKVSKDRQLKGEMIYQSKLIEREVLEIRQKYATGYYTQQQLANEYNVNQQTISRIINRIFWKHL